MPMWKVEHGDVLLFYRYLFITSLQHAKYCNLPFFCSIFLSGSNKIKNFT